MFCSSCGKQNKDDVLFCEFCGKGLPQQSSAPPIQTGAQTYPRSQKNSAPKPRVSYNVKKAIVTGILIVVVVIIVLLIYYPSIFPWNW